MLPKRNSWKEQQKRKRVSPKKILKLLQERKRASLDIRKPRRRERSLKQTKYLVQLYLEALGGPTALGIWLCLEHDSWFEAASHDIRPLDFINLEDFRAAYLAVKLLSKFSACPDGVSSEQRAALALEKYLSVEEALEISDLKLRHQVLYSTNPLFEYTRACLSIAREKIAKMLGPIESCLNSLPSNCTWGPGASSSIRGRDTTGSRKYSQAKFVTPGCLPLASLLIAYSTVWDVAPQTTASLEVITVPKNSKIDRVIGIEPDLNIYVQKGIGSFIRKRLAYAGLDLDSSFQMNLALAAVGSRDGSFATLDLSSASDTISTLLLSELLPREWMDLLLQARTPFADVQGTPILLRKFSSMGNGFTFELESLVFYCLALAVGQLEKAAPWYITVFGDDIVVPTYISEKLSQVLTDVGFVINDSKSYSSGYFRESCGGHYFKGVDVKPIYIKEVISNDSSLYKLANAVRRLSGRLGHSDLGPFRALYRAITADIKVKRFIPEGYGDGGLVVSFEEAAPSTKVKRCPNGIEGFYCEVLAIAPDKT